MLNIFVNDVDIAYICSLLINNTMRKNKKSSPDIQSRIVQIKSKWPKYISYATLYKEEFGDLTFEEMNKVRNFWNLRYIDQDILDNFEVLVKKYIK